MDAEEDAPLEDWIVKELKDECKTLGLADKEEKVTQIEEAVPVEEVTEVEETTPTAVEETETTSVTLDLSLIT